MQEFGDLKTEEQVLTKPPLYFSHVIEDEPPKGQSVKIQPFKNVNYIHSPPPANLSRPVSFTPPFLGHSESSLRWCSDWFVCPFALRKGCRDS